MDATTRLQQECLRLWHVHCYQPTALSILIDQLQPLLYPNRNILKLVVVRVSRNGTSSYVDGTPSSSTQDLILMHVQRNYVPLNLLVTVCSVLTPMLCHIVSYCIIYIRRNELLESMKSLVAVAIATGVTRAELMTKHQERDKQFPIFAFRVLVKQRLVTIGPWVDVTKPETLLTWSLKMS